MYERRERIGEIIRKGISEFILKEKEGDTLISVTRVVLTKDLKSAKVYITSLSKQKEILDVLKKQTPSIKAYLAKKINLRNTPSLSFFIDE